MGRIFSWEEIELGQIPELKSFELVKDMLGSELSACSSVIGALICGSVLRGDHGIRSDVDCVVLYDKEKRAEALMVMQALDVASDGLHVPLEVVPIDSGSASGPDHHAASTFIDHLMISSKIPGSVIKKNPVPFLYYDPRAFRDDTREYLKHKVRRFDKGEIKIFTASPEQKYRLIQKAFEFPVYAARKVLRCLGENFKRGDSKKEIFRIYRGLPGLSAAKEILEESLALDRWYSEQLELQIAEKNKGGYLSTIEKLQTFMPKALEFARMNLQVL